MDKFNLRKFLFGKIKTKLIVITVFFVILLNVILYFFSYEVNKEIFTSQTEDLIRAETKVIAEQLNAKYEKIQDFTDSMNLIIKDDFDYELSIKDKDYLQKTIEKKAFLISELFRDANEKNSSIWTVYFAYNVEDYNGVYQIWYSLNDDGSIKRELEFEPVSAFEPSNEDMQWYFMPLNSKKGSWTPVYEDMILKVLMYSYVAPAFNEKGDVIGIGGVDFELKSIQEMVESMKFFENGYSFLISAEKTLIVEPKKEIDPNLLERLFAEMETNKNGMISDAESFLYYSNLPNGQVVVSCVAKNEIMKKVIDSRTKIALVTIIVVIVFIVILSRFLGKITKPIVRLNNAAIDFGNGKLDNPININTNDEIGELAVSFNKMTQALGKSRKELEKKVFERTKELEVKNSELTRFNQMVVGRELTMIELKKRIEELEKKDEK